MAFYELPFEPYAPIRRQLLNLFREVNRVRMRAGFGMIPVEVVPLRRRIVKPFAGPNEVDTIAIGHKLSAFDAPRSSPQVEATPNRDLVSSPASLVEKERSRHCQMAKPLPQCMDSFGGAEKMKMATVHSRTR